MKDEQRISGRVLRWLTGVCIVVLVVVIGGSAVWHAMFPQKYSELVEKYAAQHEVDPALVYAVIKTESNFNPEAVSVNDACGLMQMLPDTFAWMQRKNPGERAYVREDLFDPEISIRYGVYFLDMLLERFGSVEEAAAAYHAGPSAVDRWLANPEYSADGVHLDRIPYEDTAHYVKKITSYYAIYSRILRAQ
ncbi:MAG: lytic transglycosylase domain-containing protein [Clostridia bacterium]|nr:lytic transglycosylase domain-containing protein [Clostridia bacterium]